MGNTEIAYAAFALSSVAATSALEVRKRAVTQGDIRGRVCSLAGAVGFGASTGHTSDLSVPTAALRQSGSLLSGSSEIGIAKPSGSLSAGIATRNYAQTGVFSVMNSVQLSKPRTGYCAMSGTG